MTCKGEYPSLSDAKLLTWCELVNGVPKGQYTDKHKAVAKEAAAHQALQAVRQGR